VLVSVPAAFAGQCTIAVAAGDLLHLLPQGVLEGIVATLFATGAVLLLREGFREPDRVDVDVHAARVAAPFGRIVLTSFGVLLAAEWGDSSQQATAALAARLGNPIAVGLGSCLPWWSSQQLRSLPVG
jgi:putative Ca2+/H+ antiporter (TMEM165/GDT1 family)